MLRGRISPLERLRNVDSVAVTCLALSEQAREPPRKAFLSWDSFYLLQIASLSC